MLKENIIGWGTLWDFFDCYNPTVCCIICLGGEWIIFLFTIGDGCWNCILRFWFWLKFWGGKLWIIFGGGAAIVNWCGELFLWIEIGAIVCCFWGVIFIYAYLFGKNGFGWTFFYNRIWVKWLNLNRALRKVMNILLRVTFLLINLILIDVLSSIYLGYTGR